VSGSFSIVHVQIGRHLSIKSAPREEGKQARGVAVVEGGEQLRLSL
jgi:hypothetical protein